MRLVVFCTALSALAAAFPAAASDRPPMAMPVAPTPALPSGRLAPAAQNDTSVTFLSLDQTAKTGDVADIWALKVFDPPIQIGKDKIVVQDYSHVKIDCQKHTGARMASIGYDESGLPLVALGPLAPTSLEAGDADTLIADALCRGIEPPAVDVQIGAVAALKAGRAILQASREGTAAAQAAAAMPAPN